MPPFCHFSLRQRTKTSASGKTMTPPVHLKRDRINLFWQKWIQGLNRTIYWFFKTFKISLGWSVLQWKVKTYGRNDKLLEMSLKWKFNTLPMLFYNGLPSSNRFWWTSKLYSSGENKFYCSSNNLWAILKNILKLKQRTNGGSTKRMWNLCSAFKKAA